MKQIQLFLDGTEIDLTQENQISINYACADIDKLEGNATKGSFSYEITIPATDSNKKFFYFPELILEDSFDASTEKEALLEVDGTPILRGYARIKSIIKDGSIANYKVILYEGNSGWISALKDQSIKDIDFANYDQIYNKVNQQSTNSFIPNTFVSYPLIHLGKLTKGETEWSVEDRYPAFNLRTIFNRIFKDAGYTVVSDFIDSEFFSRLYMTTDKVPERKKSELEPHKFKVLHDMVLRDSNGDPTPSANAFLWKNNKPLVEDLFVKPDFNFLEGEFYESGTGSSGVGTQTYTYEDLGFYYNSTDGGIVLQRTPIYNDRGRKIADVRGHYLCNFKGKMSFNYDYNLSNKCTSGGTSRSLEKTITIALVRYRRDSVGYKMDILETRNPTIAKAKQGTPQYITGSFNSQSVETEIGDYYTFLVRCDSAIDNSNDAVAIEHEGNRMYNKVYSTLTDGTDLIISDNIPDIKQKDIIADVRSLFNLYFYTDELSKKVYIEPRDNFYSQTAIDWSSKLDVSKSKIISHLGDNLGDEITFTYNIDSSDKYIKTIEESTNDDDILLSKTIDNTNKNAKDGTTVKRINNFAPTYLGSAIVTAPTAKIAYIGSDETFDTDTKKVTKWKPRLLFHKGITNLTNGEFWRYEGVEYDYFPDFTVNYQLPNYEKHLNSLDWNDKYYAKGLYSRYWSNTINTINESRKVQLYLKLDALDILNLDFRTPIYLEESGDGHYYHLEQIHDYTPNAKGSFKCTLIKVIAPTPIAEYEPIDDELLRPPFIDEEGLEQEPPVTNDSFDVVITEKVWLSTDTNPSGEWVDLEQNATTYELNAQGQITPNEDYIKIN